MDSLQMVIKTPSPQKTSMLRIVTMVSSVYWFTGNSSHVGTYTMTPCLDPDASTSRPP
jgi:hypothetical protein